MSGECEWGRMQSGRAGMLMARGDLEPTRSCCLRLLIPLFTVLSPPDLLYLDASILPMLPRSANPPLLLHLKLSGSRLRKWAYYLKHSQTGNNKLQAAKFTLLLNPKMSLIRIALEDFLDRSSRSVTEVLRTSSGTLGPANLTCSRLQVAYILWIKWLCGSNQMVMRANDLEEVRRVWRR
jgi:hypothetical protein